MKYETEENALQKGSQAVQENRQQNAQAQLTQDNSSRRIPTLKCADKKQLDEVKAPQDLLQQDTPLNSIHRGDGTTAKSAKSAICPDCPYLDEIPPAPAKIIQELQQRIEQLLK